MVVARHAVSSAVSLCRIHLLLLKYIRLAACTGAALSRASANDIAIDQRGSARHTTRKNVADVYSPAVTPFNMFTAAAFSSRWLNTARMVE